MVAGECTGHAFQDYIDKAMYTSVEFDVFLACPTAECRQFGPRPLEILVAELEAEFEVASSLRPEPAPAPTNHEAPWSKPATTAQLSRPKPAAAQSTAPKRGPVARAPVEESWEVTIASKQLGFKLDKAASQPTILEMIPGGGCRRAIAAIPKIDAEVGMLGVGSEILAVGSQSVQGLSYEDAVSVIKGHPERPLTLTLRAAASSVDKQRQWENEQRSKQAARGLAAQNAFFTGMEPEPQPEPQPELEEEEEDSI